MMQRLALTLFLMSVGGLAHGFELPGVYSVDESVAPASRDDEAIFTPPSGEWLMAPTPVEAEAAADEFFLLQPKGNGTFRMLPPEAPSDSLPAPNMLALPAALWGGTGILPVLG